MVAESNFYDEKFLFTDILVSNGFEQQGYSLATEYHDGYTEYKTRITIEKHVENDPILKCRNYLDNRQYSMCLKERYNGQLLSTLRCIPPWLGGNRSKWCNSSFDIVNGKDKK